MEIIKLSSCLEWEKTLSPNIVPGLRESFDCGKPSLNEFIRQYARQADEQNTTRTFVSLDQGNKKIAGYVSLSNTSIEKALTSDVLKSRVNPIPALLIGRLAVDSSYRRQGLGEKLLVFAFDKALAINEMSAIQAIVVDTLDEEAKAFYERYGFQKISGTNKMIISLKNLQ
jgi:ribosomal protein S18 acetylase RimI-like enzyme